MTRRVALITGVTGQDGSYLAEFLLAKGYEIHGLVRRNSDFTSRRIDKLINHPAVTTHYGDMVDATSMHALLTQTRPTEIYNLAAQSHVQVSFNVPDYSAEVNAVGCLRLLSLVKELGLAARFYQASTSELYGGLPETAPQSEDTPFTPRSPYAAAKLFAYWAVRNYREAYGLHAVNGVLFNHESPRRGRTFVTKKSRRLSPESPEVDRTASSSAISTRSATGATRQSTWRRCGSCCNRIRQGTTWLEQGSPPP